LPTNSFRYTVLVLRGATGLAPRAPGGHMFVSLRMAVALIVTVVLGFAIPARALVAGGYHILPLPDYYAKTGQRPPGGGDGPLNYYGGSVFSHVKLVTVIWGSDVNQETAAKIPLFSADLVNSTYMDQMAEYGTLHKKAVDGHRGTKQQISRGTYLGQVQISPRNTATQLTDADIQKELAYQIRSGALPTNDLDTLYMLYFPASITIELDGFLSCKQFGAYHFAKRTGGLRKNNLFYTVEPDCSSGFDDTTYKASHEFVEAVTDNIPTPGNFPDFPQAWNDVNGGEAGDLCPFSGTLTHGVNTWTVTQFYLDSQLACSMNNYQSP
jgi:hypothetical protein